MRWVPPRARCHGWSPQSSTVLPCPRFADTLAQLVRALSFESSFREGDIGRWGEGTGNKWNGTNEVEWFTSWVNHILD